MIEHLAVQYGVKESCSALRVSRSAFYRWRSGQESRRAREQRELVQKIEQVFKAHAQRYGSPRVTRALRQEGLSVGKNRVARLMRQQQLVARKKRAFRPQTTVAGDRTEPNRIAHLVPERPDQVWISDITYVATAEGWLYLAVILDLFSRRVVGWKLNDRLEAGHDVCSLAGMAPRTHSHVDIRGRDLKLLEEHIRHVGVIMLAGMDEALLDPGMLPERAQNGRDLHEIGTRADYVKNMHAGPPP